MKLFLITGLIFLVVSFLTFVSGIAITYIVGNMTHSGFAGICGPYGPYAGLEACLFFGTFPLSLVAGGVSSWIFYRYFSKRS
jgi:hypothetical protein